MKKTGKGSIAKIGDFSGGLVTKAPLIGNETKFSPDCLNVYAEGRTLRKRLGISKVNTAAVGTNPNGNGIYNWVRSASEQYLLAQFGSQLTKMDITGSAWDGTFDTIGPDASNGTQFSDSLMHFVTFSGTLIITSEARDKPQYMRATDSSHFNLEYSGSGTAPQAKYCQVWKEHVWLMNIGSGGDVTEDCESITSWTDNDAGSSVSSQITFEGNTCFRFLADGNDDAKRTKDIGTLPDNFSIDIRTYFDKLSTAANGDYAELHFDNGVILLQVRFSDDGLEIYDGAAWKEVGVNLVSEDAWATWRFVVTGGALATARVDVYKNRAIVGVQCDCSNATASNDGQIDIFGRGGSNGPCDWYLDYLYITTTTAKTEYISNDDIETWTAAAASRCPDSWGTPLKAYTHILCTDNAADTTVTDAGISATNGTMNVNTSTIYNTGGKISSYYQFVAAVPNSNYVNLNGLAGNIASDTSAAVSIWVSFANTAGNQTIFSFSDQDDVDLFACYYYGGTGSANIQFQLNDGGVTQIQAKTPTSSVSSGSWTWLLVQQSSAEGLECYINNVKQTLTWTDSTDKYAWADDVSGCDCFRIGNLRAGNTEQQGISCNWEDFRYYRHVLTSSERDALWKEGSGTKQYNTIAREGTVFTQGTYACAITATDGSAVFTQTLGTGTALSGVASVLGAWVALKDSADTYRIQITDGIGTHTSPVITTTTTAYEYQTLEFTPSSSATTVKLDFLLLGAGTYYIDKTNITTAESGVLFDNSDRVQRSAVGEYNDWDGTDSGYNDITTPGDIGITGSFILRGNMFVTKKWSIHKFTYTASTPLVQILQVRSTIGTASPRSMQKVDMPGQGEVIIFLGADRRLYMFDGAYSTPISDPIAVGNGIASVYMDNINAQALDKVFAIVHPDKNWYEIFVPIGSSAVPNYSIVYDYLQKSFWVFDNRNFRAGAYSDNGAGQREAYVQATSTGFTYLSANTSSDDGTDINAYWLSFKIGEGIALRKMDEVEVETDSVACNPIFSWRCDWETTWTSKTLSASSYSHNWNPHRIDNYIQFKIEDDSSDTTFKLWAISMNQRLLGGAK